MFWSGAATVVIYCTEPNRVVLYQFELGDRQGPVYKHCNCNYWNYNCNYSKLCIGNIDALLSMRVFRQLLMY